MAAMITEVSEDVDSGMTTIAFGLTRHLGPPDMIELSRMNRARNAPFFINLRASGSTEEGGSVVEFGRDVPVENSSTGTGRVDQFILSGLTDTSQVSPAALASSLYVIQQSVKGNDAKMGMYKLKRPPVTGPPTVDDDAGKVDVALVDCEGKHIKLRKWDVCRTNPTTGSQESGKAIFMSSDFIPNA